jgi:hypothetical protein
MYRDRTRTERVQNKYVHGERERERDSNSLRELPRTRVRKRDPVLDTLRDSLAAAYRETRSEDLDWPPSAWGDLKAVRKSIADDTELLRRWRAFLADAYWPIKSVHKFRSAFTHPKFKPQAAATVLPLAGIRTELS